MGSGYSAWTLLGVRCCKVQGAVPLQPALLCRVGRLLYCSAVVGVCSIRLDTLLCQSALVRTQLAWRETRALPVTNSLCLFLLKSKLFHLLEAMLQCIDFTQTHKINQDEHSTIALCVYPHCKVSIGQYTKMCTSPLIFFQLHYFRCQIFEENIWSLSLSLYIWPLESWTIIAIIRFNSILRTIWGRVEC